MVKRLMGFVFAVGWLPAVPVGATEVLTGRFSGTSVGTQLFTPPFGTFNGTPASGSFRIDLTGCSDQSFSNPAVGPNCGGGSGPFDAPKNYLVLMTTEGTVKFRAPDYLVQVSNLAGKQVLSVNFSFMDAYSSAYLRIAGGADAFIHGVDFGAIYPGRIDLAGSSLQYQDGRSYAGQVALTSLRFTNVPEPSSLAASVLAVFGLVSVRGLTRRR